MCFGLREVSIVVFFLRRLAFCCVPFVRRCNPHAGEIELHQPVPTLKWHRNQVTCVGSTGVVDQKLGGLLSAQQRLQDRDDSRLICEVKGCHCHRNPLGAEFRRKGLKLIE